MFSKWGWEHAENSKARLPYKEARKRGMRPCGLLQYVRQQTPPAYKRSVQPPPEATDTLRLLCDGSHIRPLSLGQHCDRRHTRLDAVCQGSHGLARVFQR
ncbi:hypothetical protein Lfu02_15540 [Longispora fulva]|nr:hypothetical protein Lfu02_15540 [Longispora fulva]